MVLPVKDDAVLNNLKIGEKVIMTYAEAFAIELVKAK
jgi:Cu/Ag efflux protein CusF